jgi:NADH dehydrogenase
MLPRQSEPTCRRHTPRPFRYKHDGDLATISKRAAVIDFSWTKLTGRPAWWLWGLAHIYF